MNFYALNLLFLGLCLSTISFGQNSNIPLNLDFEYPTEKVIYSKKSNSFTAFKPLLKAELQVQQMDSFPSFFNRSLIQWEKGESKFTFNPVLHFQTYLEGEELGLGGGLGFSSQYSFSQKLTFALDFAYYNIQYPRFQTDHIDQAKAISSQAMEYEIGRLRSKYISAYVNYAPSSIFDFQLGYGRNFIGDGYRSLLLSDHANAYPYLRINTKIWKLKYTNLFSIQQNSFMPNFSGKTATAPSRTKYSSTHFLDFKATKWLSIGLFETVIWQGKDSIYQRGFDVNYLNPVIFYRPVEFSTGSADNVLIGLNLKIQPWEKQVFYSQIVLDEFLMAEMRADVKQAINLNDSIQSGWWANKYGIQLGWHVFDLLGIDGLETRLEYNRVRPFTYAHNSPDQSYTHQNLPLAHPLGANFQEGIVMLDYYWKKWRFHFQYNYSSGGKSIEGTNFGDNVLVSNTTRYREYENELGQGIAYHTHYTDINISYLIQSEWKLYAQVGYLTRSMDIQKIDDKNYLYVKLSTALFNQYFDY